jgi:hypothetical protein
MLCTKPEGLPRRQESVDSLRSISHPKSTLVFSGRFLLFFGMPL